MARPVVGPPPHPAPPPARRLRLLCLHGYRTSARILQDQVRVGGEGGRGIGA
jgi:hypothetical protein